MRKWWVRLLLPCLASVLVLAACNGDGSSLVTGGSENGGAAARLPSQLQSSPKIQVLSNRADLVSGGNVLVKVLASADAAPGSVSMSLNGQDVTGAFQQLKSGSYMGLVKGLKDGKNTLVAHLPSGDATTQIINHPIGGPVLSGPQLQPWACQNKDGKQASVADDCNQAPTYSYFYQSSNALKAGLQPYDLENPPSDVASTTTSNGVVVPFIVRVETGYQDRDQYKIAVLYQPGKPWTAVHPQPQFNHKMLINHGASCGVDYQSGTAPSVISYNPIGAVTSALPDALDDLTSVVLTTVVTDSTVYALGNGFVVMSTALNNSGHNCNLVLQAESMMMAKERTIEQYGTLRYTIGEGCSGGSFAQQWVANAYPGIYQGLLPTCSFPDAWSTATQFMDYHLLINYFNNTPPKWGPGIVWLPTQMADVEGSDAILNSFVSDSAQFHVAVPTDDCAGVTAQQRYNPKTNPGGVRCDIQDAAINIFGPRPKARWSPQEKQIGHGFAGFPVDNVGVQYGLKMLQTGDITPAMFIDLNQKIGGLDVDTNFTKQRLVAEESALANAYRSGMINEGNNMGSVAIIDCRGPDPGLFHDAYRAFAMRARLERENGTHANQLIWEGAIPIIGDLKCAFNSFKAMDRWLSVVEQDTSKTPLPQKIIESKPGDLQDRCYSGVGIKLNDGLCVDITIPDTPPILNNIGIVAIYGTPRTIAGDDITTDNNKCQLRALDRSDNYGPLGLSDAQWAEMHKIFPHGVCDFSKPGVSQQPTIPWQTYQTADGDVIYGGKPLPQPPANSGAGWAAPAFDVFAAARKSY